MQSKLIAITGPSGVGKSTVINTLLKRHADWQTVSSYTTRERRVNEDDTKRYTFVTLDEFRRLKDAGDILEAEEYAGNWYGTSRASLQKALAAGPVVLLDMQVKGVQFMKQAFPDARSIYLYAPVSEVQRRLDMDSRRAHEPHEQRAARLAAVARLNRQRHIYDHCITSVPNEIEQTVNNVEAAIVAQ